MCQAECGRVRRCRSGEWIVGDALPLPTLRADVVFVATLGWTELFKLKVFDINSMKMATKTGHLFEMASRVTSDITIFFLPKKYGIVADMASLTTDTIGI
jgi:hypothetical protein